MITWGLNSLWCSCSGTSPPTISHPVATEVNIIESITDRWPVLWPGCTYPLMSGDPDRKWFPSQVTSPGGPSCPHAAWQEGRMRSVVLRHHSVTLPSSASLEQQDYWFQACLPLCSLLFVSLSFHIFFLVSAPALSDFHSCLLLSFFFLFLWDVSKHCKHKPQHPISHSIRLKRWTSSWIYCLFFNFFWHTIVYLWYCCFIGPSFALNMAFISCGEVLRLGFWV